MSDFDTEINELIQSIMKGRGFRFNMIYHPESMFYSTSEKSDQFVSGFISYMIKGEGKGYSQFFSYKAGIKLIKLIKQNMSLALLSEDPSVRSLAQYIYKDNTLTNLGKLNEN